MENIQTFTFKKINRDIKHNLFGKLLFKNTDINNVYEFNLWYDLMNDKVTHKTLDYKFFYKLDRIRTTYMQMHETTKDNAGIAIIIMLKQHDYIKLQELWQNTFN